MDTQAKDTSTLWNMPVLVRDYNHEVRRNTASESALPRKQRFLRINTQISVAVLYDK